MDQNRQVVRPYFYLSFLMLLVLWLVKWVEYKFSFDFAVYGVYPQKIYGLRGVVFSPLIHSDTLHLLNNSLPIFLLLMTLIYFYRGIASKVFLYSWVLSGIGTWLIARSGYHIGASGLIYALASFLFFSGAIRKHPRLMAISLVVVFIYGGLVWGVFPYKQEISWEGHLSGAISGVILALVFQNSGPKRKEYHWPSDDEKSEYDKYLEELALSSNQEELNEAEDQAKRDSKKLSHSPFRYHYPRSEGQNNIE